MGSERKYKIGFFFWDAIYRYKYYLFVLIGSKGEPILDLTEDEILEAEKQFQAAKRDFAKAAQKSRECSVKVPIQLIESVRLTEPSCIANLRQLLKYIKSIDSYLETIKFF